MALYTTRRIRTTQQRFGGQRFGSFGEAPKTLRPTSSEPLKLAQFEPDDRVTAYRRGVVFPIGAYAQLERRAVPISQVYGSVEERIVYKALAARQVPFDFQSSLLGGRIELGGLVADFILLDRPLAIPVQGSFWHEGYAERERDSYQYDLLRLAGYEVDEVWDYQIHPEYVFDQWLKDHIDLRPPIGIPPPSAFALSGLRNDIGPSAKPQAPKPTPPNVGGRI